MEFDYLLAAFWLTFFMLFFAPIAVIERRRNDRRNKRFSGI